MLLPLWEEHQRHGEAVLLSRGTHDLAQLQEWIGNRDADIFIVSEKNSALHNETPCLVNAGCVTGRLNADLPDIASYAKRAAKLLQRGTTGHSPVVLLGGIETRFLTLLDSLVDSLGDSEHNTLNISTFNWSAARIRKPPLMRSLRAGLAATLFTGHGTPQGWLAYGGISCPALLNGTPWTTDETIGLLFSLSCKTGQDSFALELVTNGIAGAVLAPTSDVLHESSRHLAHAIMKSLAAGAGTLADILRIASQTSNLQGYAIFGDPALPPAASADAWTKSQKVFAPAPDFDLRDLS
jgi:Peptidase family C25